MHSNPSPSPQLASSAQARVDVSLSSSASNKSTNNGTNAHDHLRLSPPHSSSPLLRRSPPPPKINLDNCRPFISPNTTFTNTSSNSATSFIFASSRTTRSIHSALSPTFPDFPTPSMSPGTPPVSPTASTSRSHRSRPSLSSAQLAKHSQGALDARCIVGPNMRAAGFIPLSHTLTPITNPQLLPSPTDSPLPTPGSTGIPTPNDPPPFPPIIFVNPSMVTSTPMWDYQRSLGWGISGKQAMGFSVSASTSTAPPPLGPAFVHVPPSESHSCPSDPPPSLPSVPHSSTSSSQMSKATFSPFSLFADSSSSSAPSVASSVSLHSKSKSKARIVPSKAPVSTSDGYPFPLTPPRQRKTSNTPSNASISTTTSAYQTADEEDPLLSAVTPSSVSPVQKSSTAVARHSSSSISFAGSSHQAHNPTALTHSRSKASRETNEFGTPSFIIARRTRRYGTHDRELSLTELCDSSSHVWSTDVDCLGPLPSSHNSSTTSLSGGRTSTGSSRPGSSASGSTQARGRTKDRNGRVECEQVVEKLDAPTMDHIVEELEKPIAQVGKVEEEKVLEVEEVVVKEDIWEAVKERAQVREKGKHKEKSKSDKSDDDNQSKGSTRSKGDRTSNRSRGSSGHAQYSYSSFSFPPNTTRERKTSPHHLGDSLLTNKEHEPMTNSKEHRDHHHRERTQRDRKLGALVQAHRDRDREQAKQSEREHRHERELGREEKYDIEDPSDVQDEVHELDRDWETPFTVRFPFNYDHFISDPFLLQKHHGRGRGRGGLHTFRSKTRTVRPTFGGSEAPSDTETMVE